MPSPGQVPSNNQSPEIIIIAQAAKPAAEKAAAPLGNFMAKALQNKTLVAKTSASATAHVSYEKWHDIRTKNADRQLKLAPLQNALIKEFKEGKIGHAEFIEGYNHYSGDGRRATTIIKAVNKKLFKNQDLGKLDLQKNNTRIDFRHNPSSLILNGNCSVEFVHNKPTKNPGSPYGSISSNRTLFTGVDLEKSYHSEYSASESSFLNFFSGPAGFILIWGGATVLLGSIISLAAKLINDNQSDDVGNQVNSCSQIQVKNKIDLDLFVGFNEGSIKFFQASLLLINDYKFSETQAKTLLVGSMEIFMTPNTKSDISSNLKEKVDLQLIKLFNQNKITKNQALQILVFDYNYLLDEAKLLLGV